MAGNRIASLSDTQNLSRADLAEILGTDLLTVARYEDCWPVPPDARDALSRLFGVSAQWLTGTPPAGVDSRKSACSPDA